jgi:hypothetical protein
MNGDEGDRTLDLGVANAALSQLSYIPIKTLIFFISNSKESVNLKKYPTVDSSV